MGLQNQLSDVSSQSIIVLIAVLLGKSVRYLQSILFTVLHNLGIFYPQIDPDRHQTDKSVYDVVGSGLADLIVLCDQLILNRDCSRQIQSDAVDELDTDCVVCLNRLGEGDHVRRLACRHVFHKDCFDGWLSHLNFDCPLCRAPVASNEREECTQMRVAEDLLAWFPFQ